MSTVGCEMNQCGHKGCCFSSSFTALHSSNNLTVTGKDQCLFFPCAVRGSTCLLKDAKTNATALQCTDASMHVSCFADFFQFEPKVMEVCSRWFSLFRWFLGSMDFNGLLGIVFQAVIIGPWGVAFGAAVAGAVLATQVGSALIVFPCNKGNQVLLIKHQIHCIKCNKLMRMIGQKSSQSWSWWVPFFSQARTRTRTRARVARAAVGRKLLGPVSSEQQRGNISFILTISTICWWWAALCSHLLSVLVFLSYHQVIQLYSYTFILPSSDRLLRRILVMGGTRFIGCYLVAKLREMGHSVVPWLGEKKTWWYAD